MKNHPAKKMLDRGLLITLNSDDPAYFGGYVNDNFYAIADALDLSSADIITLVKNAFSGSFLPKDQVTKHLQQIDQIKVS